MCPEGGPRSHRSGADGERHRRQREGGRRSGAFRLLRDNPGAGPEEGPGGFRQTYHGGELMAAQAVTSKAVA